MPTLLIIAGPNGAGKSTFARWLGLNTIDPDRLALEAFGAFTPETNLKASRLALRLVQQALDEGRDVAQETTLSGGQPLRLMAAARARGYEVFLVFVTTGDDTRLRIDGRVLLGGHDIVDADLRRRAPRILDNLSAATRLADLTALYTSSDVSRSFTLAGIEARGVLTGSASLSEDVRSAVGRVSRAVIDDGALRQLALDLQDKYSFVRFGEIRADAS